MLNVILNLALFALKFIGGKLSRSVSVTSDAFNNLTDAITTMFAWIGLKISSVGAGEEHPNGHGRFEWAVALVSSSSVILIGWELLRNSINAIKNPEQTVFGVFTVVVLLVSVGVKFFMFLYNKKKGKEMNSSSLKAVSADCLSDAVSTAVVLVSLIINTVFSVNIDGWCGILVSLFIMYNGFSSFAGTVERIMGKSASKEQLNELQTFVLKNADFEAVADLQIEDYGFGRYRASMSVIGKEGVGAEKLLSDIIDLKYRIFEHYGYNAQISIERHSEKNDDITDYIDNTLSDSNVPLQILSLRINNAGEYRLVILDIGIDLTDSKKKAALENELSKKFETAPEGIKVLLRVRLKRNSMYYGKERHHAHSNH